MEEVDVEAMQAAEHDEKQDTVLAELDASECSFSEALLQLKQTLRGMKRFTDSMTANSSSSC